MWWKIQNTSSVFHPRLSSLPNSNWRKNFQKKFLHLWWYIEEMFQLRNRWNETENLATSRPEMTKCVKYFQMSFKQTESDFWRFFLTSGPIVSKVNLFLVFTWLKTFSAQEMYSTFIHLTFEIQLVSFCTRGAEGSSTITSFFRVTGITSTWSFIFSVKDSSKCLGNSGEQALSEGGIFTPICSAIAGRLVSYLCKTNNMIFHPIASIWIGWEAFYSPNGCTAIWNSKLQ